MELLNGLIHLISIDFDSNNNSTPVDYSTSDPNDQATIDKPTEKELDRLVIELLGTLKEWKQSIEFIESQCPLHDYKDVKANGYRSMFKINILAIKRVNKKLSDKQLTIKHLFGSLVLARLLAKINNKIKEFHHKDQEVMQNLDNNNETSDELKDKNQLIPKKLLTSNNLFTCLSSIEFFEFYDKLEHDLADYFRYHPIFYFRNNLRKSGKALILFLSKSSSLPSSLMFNNKKRSKAIAKSLNNPTLSFPFSIINQIDCSVYKDVLIPLKYLNDGLSTSTVYLPRQYKFLLNDLNTCINTKQCLSVDKSWSYELLKATKISKNDKIRIRIIKDKSKLKTKTVMFHVHGGK